MQNFHKRRQFMTKKLLIAALLLTTAPTLAQAKPTAPSTASKGNDGWCIVFVNGVPLLRPCKAIF